VRWWGRRGLRARIVIGFGVGALLVSAVLVTTTFLLARGYLLDQRERSLTRQAFVDANALRSRLSTAGAQVGDVLGDLVPSGGADVVVRQGDAWFSSALDVGEHDVPRELRDEIGSGQVAAATEHTLSGGGPRLVVGVAVPSVGVDFYEISPLTALQAELHTLAVVLAAGAGTATAAGAAFGIWTSRRVVRPLEEVAGAAGRIAGGELTTRLAPTEDPDLVAIVGSFNSMVDALAARIERDARFVGDVSHELRSPLTSLITSVEVMGKRRAELPPRSQQALALVEGQLDRFRRTLDDLLELARLDNGPAEPESPVSLSALAREVLLRTGRSVDLLHADGDAATTVRADKGRLERAMGNLLDNADRHAGGARGIHVERRDGAVVLSVDDAGPGVAGAERERIFERFVRGSRAGRGSLPGAGLGLAIVAETASQQGGAAWCSTSPAGGARFSLSLPAAEARGDGT
jgi:two-component system sensor histidine kinase MtrB